MLVVETVAKIRRAYFAQGKGIERICRELRPPWKIVRKVLRPDETAFSHRRSVQPQPKLGLRSDELDRFLAANAARRSRERALLTRIFEGEAMRRTRGPGCEGGYDAVRRYAASWRRRESAITAAAFVPSRGTGACGLRGTRAFGATPHPGEAYRFDRR